MTDTKRVIGAFITLGKAPMTRLVSVIPVQNLYKIWSRPVHVETILDEAAVCLSYDGREHSETEIE